MEASAPRPEPLSPGGVNSLHKRLQHDEDQVRATRAGNQLSSYQRELYTLLEAHLRAAQNLTFAIGNDMERWG